MIIRVRVKPAARVRKIEITGADEMRVAVPAPARNNQANRALIEILSEFFHIPKPAVRIIRGQTARQKLVEIVGLDRLPPAPSRQPTLL